MSDTDRVQRWRKRQRKTGKEPMTIWLELAEKLRLEDFAQTWHCSPSTLVQQALAQYHPGSPAVPGTVADTAQLRVLVEEPISESYGVPNSSQCVTATLARTSHRWCRTPSKTSARPTEPETCNSYER